MLELLIRKSQAVTNARFYGTTGLGVTDDTAAIRKAIVAARGGTLVLPKGIYSVTEDVADEIFLLDQSIRIEGVGANVEGTWIKVKSTTPDDVDVFHIKPAQTSIPFVAIRGIMITPDTPDGFTGGRHGIHIETDEDSQLQRFVIEDCWINAGAGKAIVGQDADVSVSTAAYYQSVIQRNVLFGFSGGIHFTECGDSITIADNVIPAGGGLGIYIKAVAGAAHQVIERNGFQGTPLGAIMLEDCVQAKVRDNQVEQGSAYGGTEGGLIVLKNCFGCEVTGNNLNGFDQVAPIMVTGGSTRNTISANVLGIANSGMVHAVISDSAGIMNALGEANVYLVNNVPAEPLLYTGVHPQIGIPAKLTTFNSWVDHTTGGWDGLYYRANVDDTVSLFGNLKDGLGTAATNLAALPTGIIPSRANYVTALTDGGVVRIKIDTDGAISLVTTLSGSDWLSFHEARFPLT